MAYYAGKLMPARDIVAKALKHTRFMIVTQSGRMLHYVDPRNFGNLKVVTGPELEKIASKIGLDLMQRSATLEAFMEVFAKFQITKGWPSKSPTIGEVLLNQSMLAGLGNIYRAEAMYHAKISPFRELWDISSEELEQLYSSARRVLYEGYVGTIKHAVYSRSRTPAGEEVVRGESGGRTIWYAPSVQH